MISAEFIITTYLIIVLVSVVGVFNTRKIRFFISSIYSLFFILVGFRPIDYNQDTINYYKFFDAVENYNLFTIFTGSSWHEPFFTMIVFTIDRLGFHESQMVIISFLIAILSFVITIDKKFFTGSAFIFCSGVFIPATSSVRHLLALYLFMFFIYLFSKTTSIKKYILRTIAMFFMVPLTHASALAPLSIYFWQKIKIHKKLFLACFVSFLILYLDLYTHMLDRLAGTYGSTGFRGVSFIFLVFVFTVIAKGRIPRNDIWTLVVIGVFVVIPILGRLIPYMQFLYLSSRTLNIQHRILAFGVAILGGIFLSWTRLFH